MTAPINLPPLPRPDIALTYCNKELIKIHSDNSICNYATLAVREALNDANARIADLESQLQSLREQKPAAWLLKKYGEPYTLKYEQEFPADDSYSWEPLYASPMPDRSP